MANSVRYGLCNVHVASVTISNGSVTFGTPVALPGAKSLTLEPQGETVKEYADNTVYYVGTSNDGYNGTLEVEEVPQSFAVDYLGMTVDNKGNLVERSDDKQNYFALLYQFEGDEKATRHVLFYCKAARSNEEGKTTEGTIEFSPSTLSFSAAPLPGSRVIKSKTTDSTTTTVYDNWFSSAPVVPTFSTTTS